MKGTEEKPVDRVDAAINRVVAKTMQVAMACALACLVVPFVLVVLNAMYGVPAAGKGEPHKAERGATDCTYFIPEERVETPDVELFRADDLDVVEWDIAEWPGAIPGDDCYSE